MFTPFQLQKTIQAVAVLLKSSAAVRMSRLRILKLLYITERTMLEETGRMITGDRAVAMDHGPVLTSTYNLIKGQHADTQTWDRFFKRDGARDVCLIADPGNADLSRFEIAKLEAVAAKFDAYDDWALSEYTHTFAEWKAHKPAPKSRNTIPVDDVLKAVGMLGRKDDLRHDAQSIAAVDKLLATD